MTFAPRFMYTHKLVGSLTFVEAARAVVDLLPLPPDTSLRLQHDALQRSTRSSTQIEGNPLDRAAMRRAIAAGERTGGAAEQEVRNYWRALARVEEYVTRGQPPTDAFARELHRIVIVRGVGRRGRTSAYRTTECPVVDTVTRAIDYGPPEPRDVPVLMDELFAWLRSPAATELPAPIRAGILTHRFLSIHPFDDGNGRTGRLLATAELWRSRYRMRGFLSFDEHFVADRAKYYGSLQMGLPVSFYDGRHDPDHTSWLEYFVAILAEAAASLHQRARDLHQSQRPPAPPWEGLSRREQQVLMRTLSRVLEGMDRPTEIQPRDIQGWFGVSGNTAREWLASWAESGFIIPVRTAAGMRVRRYRLAQRWATLVLQARRVDQATQGRPDSTRQA